MAQAQGRALARGTSAVKGNLHALAIAMIHLRDGGHSSLDVTGASGYRSTVHRRMGNVYPVKEASLGRLRQIARAEDLVVQREVMGTHARAKNHRGMQRVRIETISALAHLAGGDDAGIIDMLSSFPSPARRVLLKPARSSWRGTFFKVRLESLIPPFSAAALGALSRSLLVYQHVQTWVTVEPSADNKQDRSQGHAINQGSKRTNTHCN